MAIPLTDAEREGILASMMEGNRLRTLSNEDLVREFLRLNTAGLDDELVGNEMCARLWPEWDKEDA